MAEFADVVRPAPCEGPRSPEHTPRTPGHRALGRGLRLPRGSPADKASPASTQRGSTEGCPFHDDGQVRVDGRLMRVLDGGP